MALYRRCPDKLQRQMWKAFRLSIRVAEFDFYVSALQPPAFLRDKGQQHLPGDETWLTGEHRMSREKKYYLANLPAAMDMRTLAATIEARWVCEQAHQQLNEELGVDHFEGRSWPGLHRHALITIIVYAFLQNRRLAKARREKRIDGPSPQPSLPAVRPLRSRANRKECVIVG
jgi:SRSO17 transposase